jgi:hypothetical protein
MPRAPISKPLARRHGIVLAPMASRSSTHRDLAPFEGGATYITPRSNRTAPPVRNDASRHATGPPRHGPTQQEPNLRHRCAIRAATPADSRPRRERRNVRRRAHRPLGPCSPLPRSWGRQGGRPRGTGGGRGLRVLPPRWARLLEVAESNRAWLSRRRGCEGSGHRGCWSSPRTARGSFLGATRV